MRRSYSEYFYYSSQFGREQFGRQVEAIISRLVRALFLPCLVVSVCRRKVRRAVRKTDVLTRRIMAPEDAFLTAAIFTLIDKIYLFLVRLLARGCS